MVLEWLSSLRNGSVDPQAVATIVAVVSLLVLVRMWFWLRYTLFPDRQGVPLQIRRARVPRGKHDGDSDPSPAEAADPVALRTATLIEIQTGVIAFVAGDPSRRLSPGSMRTVSPPPTPPAAGMPTIAWLWYLLRWLFSGGQRPAFEVHLDLLNSGETDRVVAVAVSIIRRPGARLVAAHTYSGDAKTIIREIGSFCLQQVRQQRAVRKRTPPWEQWGSPHAYELYREGLVEKTRWIDTRAAERDATDHKIARALDHFNAAARRDQSNALPRLAAAALYEMVGDYSPAISYYAFCRDQWPVIFEAAYRLLTTMHRADLPSDEFRRLAEQLHADILMDLRLPSMLKRWLRADAGTRIYLRSLMRQPAHSAPWFRGPDRRHQYRSATEAALLSLLMWDNARRAHDSADPDVRAHVRRDVEKLFARLATLHGLPVDQAVQTLLHPGQPAPANRDGRPEHSPEQHTAMIGGINYALDKHQGKAIGWMAHYNTACFLAHAFRLPPDCRPWTAADPAWAEDCLAAVRRQLRLVYKDPTNELDHNWINRDEDLAVVRHALIGADASGPGEGVNPQLARSMEWLTLEYRRPALRDDAPTVPAQAGG
ncbi:hypothetical protein [Dactylosporangium salmoneum]|uniref:Uncharacterized protein n=1 Tax=Dactylosporangium salmoneum TaxID=53361 RepID=A0ABP5SY19_9ACTN